MLAVALVGCPDATTQPGAFGGTTAGGDDDGEVTGELSATVGVSLSGASSGGSGGADGASSGGTDDADSGSSGEPAVCGDGVVAGDEACDDRGESARCNADCTLSVCGDGETNATAGEFCDHSGQSTMCDVDCTAVECGDGLVNDLVEMCDDAGRSETCNDDCTLVECGDGVVNEAAGEACDDRGESETCDSDCSLPMCGDGLANLAAGEDCDDMIESAACDADCTTPECGDGVFNALAGEICDDGGNTATCDADCTAPLCGDGVVNAAAGEQCEAPTPDCTNCTFDNLACSNGADLLSIAPGGDMVLCDDPTDTTCEEDMEILCPAGWGLCSREQHINRNAGWNVATGAFGTGEVVVGEIYCRNGNGAGHYTLGPYDGVTSLSDDPPLNCGYGSSRPVCPSAFGCTEQEVRALCCAPTPTCGNGVVDAPEETCDDMNADETDACLNSCALRMPGC